MRIRLRRASPLWPGSNGAITRRILHIVSAEKQRAKESGVVGLNLPLLENFLHRAHILLFNLLTRDFSVPLARSDLAMAQEVPDHDNLGAMFEEVGRKSMAQTVATRADACGFGVALHLFLDGFHR